jgi:hypothetical protein
MQTCSLLVATSFARSTTRSIGLSGPCNFNRFQASTRSLFCRWTTKFLSILGDTRRNERRRRQLKTNNKNIPRLLLLQPFSLYFNNARQSIINITNILFYNQSFLKPEKNALAHTINFSLFVGHWSLLLVLHHTTAFNSYNLDH